MGGWGGGKGGGWDDWGKGKGMDSIAVLKRGLMAANVLPGGRWNNDENCLFVGSLPEDTTDMDLYEIFSPFGAIPSRGVKALQTPEGICKGIGFINFLSSEAAQKAIMTLNGTRMPSLRMLKGTPKGPS